MARRTFTVKVTGVEDLVRQLDVRHVEREANQVTKTYAMKMAVAAALNAPRKDGWLKNSLISSVKMESMGVWSFGSNLPYALRQEYEHKTKKGFVRKAVWKYRGEYREAMRVLLRGLGAK